jgi:hypothetical protein
MKITTKIYLLKDFHGKKASAIATDSSDTVQVCGMRDKGGNKVYFESEAYHLSTFCSQNDIELKVVEKEDNFEILWNS